MQISGGYIGRKLRVGRMHLLLTLVTLAATSGGMFGVRSAIAQEVRSQAKLERFETISIRPVPEDSLGALSAPHGAEFRAKAMPLSVLVQMAFGINPNQMVLPDWTQTAKFDIVAKTGSDALLTSEEMRPLLQAMLAERFGMTYHREMRKVRGYEMVAAKGGLKLTPAKPGSGRGGTGTTTSIAMPSATLHALAEMLGARLGLPVNDMTGAGGDYEVELHFARENDPDSTLPSILTALNEQMGLKLVSATVPVQVVVIDHIERKPTEN